MTLRIRFRGGPLAGRTYTFGDDVERIVIGRAPERCQLVLPADMTVVGREHMALRRSLGRYRLVLNRENPVFLDGEPALDGTELGEVAELQLGVDGPRLVVQTVGATSVPETAYHGEAAPGIQDIVQQVAHRSRLNRRAVIVAVLGLIGIGAAIAYAVHRTRQDVASVTEEHVRDRGVFEEKVEELERLSAQHREATQALRERLTGVDATLEKLTPDLSSLREAVAGLGPRMEGLEGRLQRLTPRMKRVLSEATPSVYVVVVRDTRGVQHALATSWVVAEGLLATNAHVASFFEQTQPGGDEEGSVMYVRSPGAAPRDHVVRTARLHPGYGVFVQLWEEYRPTGMSPQGRLHSLRPAGAACDVALLEVDDAEGLADPLPVAAQGALEALGAGDVVGLVGYPSEDLSLGGVNLARPMPTTQIAHVTAVTNFFLAATEPSDALLVQHSLPVTGGASGSPILNDDGKVVAVLSAGNIVINPLGQRAPSAVLVNFAQRADLVRELVDGNADAAQAPRTTRWRKGISTLMSLQSAAERGALGFLKRYLEVVRADAGVDAEKLEEWSDATDTTVPGNPHVGFHDRIFQVPSAGIYVFFTFAVLGRDVDLHLLHETDDAEVYGRETSSDWYSAVRLAADDARKVRLRVTGPRNAEYRVFVYRFAP